jgi:hypothetical protein
MKTILINRAWSTTLVLFSLLAGRLAGATGDWSVDVAPYLWVPSLALDSSLPDLPPGTPPETKRFATKLSGAFMIAGQIRCGSFGLMADYAWLRLDTASADPRPAFSAVELRSNLAHATVGLTWRVPTTGPWQVELLGGVRFWSLWGEQVFQSGVLPGFTRSNDQTWTDPTCGVDVRYTFDDHWFATGKTLLGGLGSGSKVMTEAMAGVGYRFNDRCSALFGYRYLHEDFAHRGFTLDLRAQGFLLGFGFHF